MARPVWTGTISFGLVNVPVKAYTAVRDHDVHFNQLEKKTGARIRNKKVSDNTGKEVESDDIELARAENDVHIGTAGEQPHEHGVTLPADRCQIDDRAAARPAELLELHRRRVQVVPLVVGPSLDDEMLVRQDDPQAVSLLRTVD